jgi:hypothetical protein
LLTVRTRWFAAIASALGALVWLSLGGFFGAMAYGLFPPFAYYRHVGLIYGLARMLAVLCAGFGWERLWAGSAKPRYLGVALVVLLVIVDSWRLVRPFAVVEFLKSGYLARYLTHWDLAMLFSDINSPTKGEVACTVIPLMRIAMYAILVSGGIVVGWLISRWRAVRHQAMATPWLRIASAARVALVLALAGDLWVYQSMVYAWTPTLPASYASHLTVFNVEKLQFQDRRSPGPVGARQERVMELIAAPSGVRTGSYALAYQFAQFDPCAPTLRADWWASGVKRLLEARVEDSDAMRRVLGCESPKLRLVSQAVVVETVEEATRVIQETKELDQVVVLRGVPSPAVTSQTASGGRTAEGDLTVTRFTANELVVESGVRSEPGAWLVYADAFHPGWHATVNGRQVPVAEAYLAFKAVWVSAGRSVVRFTFRPAWTGLLGYGLAVFGVLFGLVLVGWCGKCCVARFR